MSFTKQYLSFALAGIFLSGCGDGREHTTLSELILNEYKQYAREDSIFKKDALYSLDGKTSSVNSANSSLIGIKNFISEHDLLLTTITYRPDSNGRFSTPSRLESSYLIGDDRIYFGHYFNFPAGIYKWYIGNDQVYSLMYEFDEKGNLKSELGSPLVGGMNNRQTMLRDVYFSTVFYDIDSVLVSTTDGPLATSFMIKESPLLPMMSYIQLDIQSDSVFYLKSYSTNRKNSNHKENLDAIIIR